MPDRFGTALFILLLAAVPAAANEIISIELWQELEPAPFEEVDADNSKNEEAAALALFEEARLTLSGMIFGYVFTYIPSDKARNVPEVLIFRPVAEIKPGDRNLRLDRRDVEGNRLYGRFTYTLENFQAARRQSWQTLSLPQAMGRGEGRLVESAAGKRAARENAIKEAVRNLLRPRLFNKPREIRGEAVFLDCPITIILAGTYQTTVKVKIHLKEVLPYTVF